VTLCVGRVFSDNNFLEEMNMVTRVFAVIRANYIEKVESKKLFEGACRGMAAALGDPHSVYFDVDQNERFTSDTQGEFGGLGIEIGIKDGILTVMSPIAGTPAYEAGILPGDRIIEIDGESTEGIFINDAVKKLRGPVGSKVTITIRHVNGRANEKITITRAKIKPASLEQVMIDPERKIAYVHLLHFTSHLGEEFDKTLSELTAQGMKGLVLDLRGNPGGLLDVAVNICNHFIAEGKIVSVKGRRPEGDRVYVAQKPGTLTHVPVVCLIDRGSASASEIVAGCLRDHKRALIVGERSYGKGSVQMPFPIPPGGALKLTTARYYTPNDTPIMDGKGIVPDILIPMSTELQLALRMQEREDKLRGAYKVGVSGLRGETEPKPEAKDAKQKEQPKQAAPVLDGDEDEGVGRRERVEDIQLKGALKILEVQMNARQAGG